MSEQVCPFCNEPEEDHDEDTDACPQPVAKPDSRVELPPLPEPYRQNPPIYSMIGPQQRAKWRKHWSKMDEEDCEQHHYKHYEWECRKTFEELETRERQLLAALTEIADLKKRLEER